MKRPRTGLILIDILLLSAAYVLMASLKPIMVSYLNTRYLVGFQVTVFLWMWSLFYLKKYHVEEPRSILPSCCTKSSIPTFWPWPSWPSSSIHSTPPSTAG
ncbi:MAG: hypothetical protein R2751_19325 [Bacteroidales bacterium]